MLFCFPCTSARMQGWWECSAGWGQERGGGAPAVALVRGERARRAAAERCGQAEVAQLEHAGGRGVDVVRHDVQVRDAVLVQVRERLRHLRGAR